VIVGRAEGKVEGFEEVELVVRPLLGQPPLPTRRGHFFSSSDEAPAHKNLIQYFIYFLYISSSVLSLGISSSLLSLGIFLLAFLGMCALRFVRGAFA
jgi:hypothetical protein